MALHEVTFHAMWCILITVKLARRILYQSSCLSLLRFFDQDSRGYLFHVMIPFLVQQGNKNFFRWLQLSSFKTFFVLKLIVIRIFFRRFLLQLLNDITLLTDLWRRLQVVAYLLMSALSAAVPITNRMRSAVVNNFTDATAAAISMTFFAFAALALSAVVSGYKLSKQTYMWIIVVEVKPIRPCLVAHGSNEIEGN